MYVLRVFIYFLTVNLVYASIEDLIITDCIRTINLKTQLSTIKYEFTLYNNGTEVIENFKWIPSENGILTHMEALIDSNEKTLKMSIHGKSEFVVILLPKKLDNNGSEKIIINEIYAKGIKPLPAQIKQNEQQRLVFVSNIYVDTTYYVKSQTTIVILPSSNEETVYSFKKPAVLKGNQITYGPYENVPLSKFKLMKIHFLNNGPFLTVPEIKRRVTVSHWGFISVEESIKLVHTGAKLKGTFSRVDFQNVKQYSFNRISYINTFLPASASDIYYRDVIGNISTSKLTYKGNHLKVKHSPRFPLMGGWKTNYQIGYKVPIYEYLYYNKKDNRFSFNMRFIDHIFNDMYVEKIETSIVLPVFANVILAKLPFAVQVLPDSYVYNYLDLKPRQVLTYVKKDLVENHIKDFQIIYEWSALVFLYQSGLIVAFLYFIFLIVIIYGRLDDITLINDEKKEKTSLGGDIKNK